MTCSKICSVCGEEKDINLFNRYKYKNKICYRKNCKVCQAIYDKQRWDKLTKEQKKNIYLKRIESGRDKLYKIKASKKWYIDKEKRIIKKVCPICNKEFKTSLSYKICCGSEECKRILYYHPEKKRAYVNKNKIRINKWQRDNYPRYKNKKMEWSKKYISKRRKSDPLFKLKGLLRDRISKFIKYRGFKKKNKTEEYVSCFGS